MTHRVTLYGKELEAGDGVLLSDLLADAGYARDLVCGGNGSCGKCAVLVNGSPVFSCQYRVHGNITVTLPKDGPTAGTAAAPHIRAVDEAEESDTLLLDLGTTTLVMAAADRRGRVLRTVSDINPQRRWGADVISRISACAEGKLPELRRLLTDKLCGMAASLGTGPRRRLLVAGNTAMLHIFWGEDPTPLGTFPYTPVFLGARSGTLPELAGCGIGTAESLPCLGPFAGADCTAGLCSLPLPAEGRYAMLADLGTNAEILLYSRSRLWVTSAAAGPCFEGAGISCGMPCVPGAVSAYAVSASGEPLLTVVGGGSPRGLCGSGIIDTAAALRSRGLCGRDGSMPGGDCVIAPGVRFTQKDMRQFQLAKAAVATAMRLLLKKAGVRPEDVEHLYISGGFSRFNTENAMRCGLIPASLYAAAEPVGNSVLRGLSAVASGKRNPADLPVPECLDLSLEPDFAGILIAETDFPR